MDDKEFQKKVLEIRDFIVNDRVSIRGLRLFVVRHKGYIFFHSGGLKSGFTAEEYGDVAHLNNKRGDILSMFSKLEFIINELLRLKILGFEYDKYEMFLQLISKIDLFVRIKYLRDWGVIDNAIFGLGHGLKEVRNAFAHEWEESNISYKKKMLMFDGFEEFRKDMLIFWKEIEDEYAKEQMNIDIDSILDELKEYVKKKA